MSKTLKEIIDEAEKIFKKDIKFETFNSKKIYEKALEIAKSENKLLEIEYIKGKLSVLDKNWQIALKHFDKVIELDNTYLKAHNAKGIVLKNVLFIIVKDVKEYMNNIMKSKILDIDSIHTGQNYKSLHQ